MADSNNLMNQLIEQLANATIQQQQDMQRLTQHLALNSENRSVTASDRGVRLREPPVYEGSRLASHIDFWIQSIQRHQAYHGWDDTRTLAFAITYIGGRANLWYTQEEANGTAPEGWQEFSRRLVAEFRPSNADLIARDRLAGLAQTSTIEAYVNNFMDTCIEVKDLSDSEACDRFMRGLQSAQLRAELRNLDSSQRTIKVYYRMALAYEAARSGDNHYVSTHTDSTRRSAFPSSSSSYSEGPTPMDVDVMQGRRRGGSSSGSNNNSNVVCFHCGKKGHMKRNCYKLRDLFKDFIRFQEGGTGKRGANNGSGNSSGSLNVMDGSSTGKSGNNNNGNGSNAGTSASGRNGDVVVSSSSNKAMNPSASRYVELSSTTTTTQDEMCEDVVDVDTSSVVSSNDIECCPSPPIVIPYHSYYYPENLPFELKPLLDGVQDWDELDIQADLNRVQRLNTVIMTDLPLYRAEALSKAESWHMQSFQVLLDNGATDCYISSNLASNLAGRYSSTDRELETAGGTVHKISDRFDFELNFQGFRCNVSAYVYDSKFDLILGRTWLKKYQPQFNWSDDTLCICDSALDAFVKIVPDGNGRETLSSTSEQREYNGQYSGELNYLVSYNQMSRMVKKREAEACWLYFMDDGADGVGGAATGSTDGGMDVYWSTLVNDFPSVFQDDLPGLPPDRGFQHVIQTEPNARPVNKPCFKMSPAELDELQKNLKHLLKLGLIQPSSSPWGSPVLFCRKKDGTFRMCIDYRALNQITIRNATPLPRIDECLDRLRGASYFSSLDLKSGYHQIRIQSEDIPKTAFNTRYGKYEFLVLPFGLSNAPPSFQSWMNELLGDFIDDFVLVYLDDVCIYSKTEEEHKTHVEQVLRRFEEAGLVANREKCHFAQRKLTFLGYEISAQGIQPATSKVKAVQEWPRPMNVQQVRQFLGLSQHYRRFIRGFSSLATPLTNLTQGTGPKKRPIVWTSECQHAFDTIKELLTSAPVLKLPDMSLPFVIETDSSDFGVGAVLQQPDSLNSKVLHPVAYESKKLSKEEQKFPAQERELIGIVHALRTWRCFVDGCPAGYTVYSDHNPLVYFRKQSKPTTRLVRWISELEMYAPLIKYKPGKNNVPADALSRIEDGSFSLGPVVKSLEPDYLYAAWDNLPEAIRIDWPLLYIDGADKKVKSEKLKNILDKERDNFVVRNGRLYRKVKKSPRRTEGGDASSGATTEEPIVKEVPYLPFALRADLVSKYHEDYGHASYKDMLDLILPRHWWPSMRKDIEQWIAPCGACQVNRRKIGKHQEEMHPLSIPKPFERWHLDFVGELPLTVQGNKWLITAVDYNTNWPIAKALPYATKEAVADFIYEEIVMKFGCPTEMVTDRGANFTSALVEAYLKRIGVNHKLTSAFHPRTNSKVERYNQTIKHKLRKLVQGAIHRWDEFVDAAVWATRIKKHSSTGFSPFYLTYGRDPRLPGDEHIPYICDKTMRDPRTIADITARELADLNQHRAAAEHRLKAVSNKDKERWDALIKPYTYEVGDLVMLTHEGKFGLEPNHKGPYIVTRVFEDFGTFQLETVAGEPLKSLVHKDRLMPAKGPKPDTPWYDPTEARKEVKRVTSTRSGRGGGGSHVVPKTAVNDPDYLTPDFIDPTDTMVPSSASHQVNEAESSSSLNTGFNYGGGGNTTSTEGDNHVQEEVISVDTNMEGEQPDRGEDEMVVSVASSPTPSNNGDASMSDQHASDDSVEMADDEEQHDHEDSEMHDNGSGVPVDVEQLFDMASQIVQEQADGDASEYAVEEQAVDEDISEVVDIEENSTMAETIEESTREEERVVEVHENESFIGNDGDQIDERVIGDIQRSDESVALESNISPNEETIQEVGGGSLPENVNLSPNEEVPSEVRRVREESHEEVSAEPNLLQNFSQPEATGGDQGRSQVSEGSDVRPQDTFDWDEIPDVIRFHNRNRKRKFRPIISPRNTKRIRKKEPDNSRDSAGHSDDNNVDVT